MTNETRSSSARTCAGLIYAGRASCARASVAGAVLPQATRCTRRAVLAIQVRRRRRDMRERRRAAGAGARGVHYLGAEVFGDRGGPRTRSIFFLSLLLKCG